MDNANKVDKLRKAIGAVRERLAQAKTESERAYCEKQIQQLILKLQKFTGET